MILNQECPSSWLSGSHLQFEIVWQAINQWQSVRGLRVYSVSQKFYERNVPIK